MKSLIELPKAEFLQVCFRYEPETGKLFWKERPREHFKHEYAWNRFNRLSAGKEAGIKMHRSTGENLCIRVKFHVDGGKIFPSVHRIIFSMKGVPIPDGTLVDHRDGDPFNNRWENIRPATSSQNTCNQKKSRTKKSGLPKGVHREFSGLYEALCMKDGKSHYLGRYKTPEEAHAAYCAFASVAHGEFFKPK